MFRHPLVISEQNDTGRDFFLPVVKINSFSSYVSCLKTENILEEVSGKPEKIYLYKIKTIEQNKISIKF